MTQDFLQDLARENSDKAKALSDQLGKGFEHLPLEDLCDLLLQAEVLHMKYYVLAQGLAGRVARR